MLKTACFLTGDNYQLVLNDTPASKKKITAMAIAMILPITIWLFSSFLLAFEVIKTGFISALITALVCGLIVFFVEKLVIMADGNRWLTLFRISIGFIVAALGSIAIDEVVFKNDIDISIVTLKNEAIRKAKLDEEKQFKLNNNYQNIEIEVANLVNRYNSAVNSAIAEADGTTGSKQAGVGVITIMKERAKNVIRKDLEAANQKLALLDMGKNEAVKKAGFDMSKAFNENALLTRIKALFSLVTSDRYMAIVYTLFTLLMFFFEFLVVILKLTWKKTNYERKLAMLEKIGEERILYLLRKGSPVYDPGVGFQHIETIKSRINKKSNVFNY